MPKVLITGANGLLATNVIRELLANGYHVRGLLRKKEKFTGSPHPSMELTEGDITESATLINNVKGCDYVIHVAALTSHSISNYEVYKKVNVIATENLLKTCINLNISKFIYVSSANTLGYGSLENPGNEKRPIRPPFSESLYAQSKLEAQQRILKYKDRINITIVNPTFIIGPFDGKPSSGKIILMAYGKKMVFCPPGGKNFVNATDVAKGILAALKKGENGEAYLLSGENLTYREFFRKVSRVSNIHAFYIVVPKLVLYIAGLTGNLMQKCGIESQLSLTNMKMLCVKNFYSNKKASLDFGVQFQPIEKGIKQAVEWFKERGMIK